MPNWTQNCIRCKDDKNYEQLVNLLVNEKDNVDFSKVIPMPEDLAIESPSWDTSNNFPHPLQDKIEAYAYGYFNEKVSQKDYSEKLIPILIRNKLISYEEKAKTLSLLKGYYNLTKYGYPDWYDWSCAKWGCKWNASDTCIDPSDNYVSFSTPWVEPRPIFEIIAEKGIDCEIICYYEGEECPFKFTISNGQISEEQLPPETLDEEEEEE